MHARVVEVPRLGALAARIPLAPGVAEGEEALLGARFLLVAPRAAEEGVEAVLGHGREQHGDLQPVAAHLAGARLHRAGGARVVHGAPEAARAPRRSAARA